MKKFIELLKQLFGLNSTAKAITTATQLQTEVKEAVIEVEQKVEEVKEKVEEIKKRVPRKKNEPKKVLEGTEKPKRGRKPKQK